MSSSLDIFVEQQQEDGSWKSLRFYAQNKHYSSIYDPIDTIELLTKCDKLDLRDCIRDDRFATICVKKFPDDMGEEAQNYFSYHFQGSNKDYPSNYKGYFDYRELCIFAKTEEAKELITYYDWSEDGEDSNIIQDWLNDLEPLIRVYNPYNEIEPGEIRILTSVI